MSDGQGAGLFYGWKIVFAILVQLTFASGLSFYNHAIYLNALAEQPAFDVSSASSAVSLFFLSGGIAGLGIARWVQAADPRYAITTGAVICAVSVSLLPVVSNLWQLFALYAFFGVGFAASALIPATTLVTRWFRRRRALALSVASTGLSLGGVVLTPLSALLVERLGFQGAAPLIGSLYLIGIIPVTWVWLRPYPRSMGLLADGEVADAGAVVKRPAPVPGQVAPSAPPVRETEHGKSFAEARRGRLFWAICLAYIFLMLAQVGGIAHQYGLAREQLNEAQTALAVAILPVASIIGRLLGGWFVERMSIRFFAIGMMILQSSSLSLLALGSNVWTLCVGLFFFGASVGNLLMLQPLLLAEAFGVRDYARIFSISNLMSSWGTALGPALLGWVYASSGESYSLPFWIAAGAGALGLTLFLSGGRIRTAD